ncbi:hypothetical protein [Nonomuraea angiospora]|uniref:hypothetical protein n=1 Tax=Nonomuraea angiospora TaxID=46172 RepID=UPI0029A4992E|nr:hypothetical protein [Nonomuraea angiospora]MDX3099689.1 hypothetical protein [Nonomuraea angiospora]
MPSDDLPDVLECKVTRLDDGRLHLTHDSGRTATAHTVRGAVLVGAALRVLAEHGGPQPPGMRPVHLEWTAAHDADPLFRTGDRP